MITREDIIQARARIADSIYVSPCPCSRQLSEMFGCEVHLKLENLQMTGSFKERGANNKLLRLSDAERRAGVIAMSAGNHAQAVAYQARTLGIAATIVMPKTTPLVKVSATRSFGANVILSGTNLDEAFQEATRLCNEQKLTFVHPFDDDDVIAGQGTIGLELLEQVPDLDAILVSVGGGGLVAGIAMAVKEVRPNVKIYGVEPKAVPSMQRAFEHGEPTKVQGQKTIADGTAVSRIGDRNFQIASKYLDDVLVVDDEAISEAILILLEREKTVAEGAGALPLAALRQYNLPLHGKKVVLIISGGNIDVNLVARIIDRGLIASGRQMRIKVRMSDQPGSLASLLAIIGSEGGNVLQIYHDRVSPRIPLGQTAIEILIETRGFDHLEQLEKAVRDAGFIVV